MKTNILRDFFNHRSDANKYLLAEQQESLENDFEEWAMRQSERTADINTLIDALKEIEDVIVNPHTTINQTLNQVAKIAAAALASYAEQAPQERSQFKEGDSVISSAKYTSGKVGEVWKVSDYGVHVRYGKGDSATFEVFHFNPTHHTQTPITLLENLETIEKEMMEGQVTGKSAVWVKGAPKERKQYHARIQWRMYEPPSEVIITPIEGSETWWSVSGYLLRVSIENDQIVEYLYESGEAGKLPEQQEINAGFLEGLKNEPFNVIRNMILKHLDSEQQTALLRWLIPEQQPADPWTPTSNPPKEGGRYWCLVEEINDLGISRFQWNCYYDPQVNEWRDNLKNMHVTHWTNLLPFPCSVQTEVSEEQKGE